MALPPSLRVGTPEAMVKEAQLAAATQWEHIQSAAAATLAAVTAKTDEEAAARRSVEVQLRGEMVLLEKERLMLIKEAHELRESVNVGPLTNHPQVIFQDVVAAGQEVRSKIDAATAEQLAADVAAALKKLTPLPQQSDSISMSKETALTAEASLVGVQKRLKEVLQELEARVRLENTRMRLALQQTDEAIRTELAQNAEQQLTSQKMQLKEYMDAQSHAMIEAARAAIKQRNYTYSKYLSDLFDEASQRAIEYANVSARLLAAEEALKLNSALESTRSELAGKYSLDANTRIQLAEDLNLRLKVLSDVLVQGEEATNPSRSMQVVSVAVDTALQRLGKDELIGDDLTLVAASSDPVVQQAVASIPNREPLATKDKLLAEFECNLPAARRALLVPPGSGFVGEAYGTVRALTLMSFSDTELPDVTSSPESRLRRARVLLHRGDVAGSVEEVGRLPANMTGALNKFIVDAKQRLVVEQALRLIRAHALTNLASLS